MKLQKALKGPYSNKFMDLRNFDKDNRTCNVANKGKLGKLKNETGSIQIK